MDDREIHEMIEIKRITKNETNKYKKINKSIKRKIKERMRLN